ncbi:unnamed protein product [Staurois parvus]|uniref:Uncharacterized protein n=1 Tax=Staurois parvus TaxID=386267 RepID=A0ABN9DHE5_9NEOB|nr:unnamed protein product [Staurois parvus]
MGPLCPCPNSKKPIKKVPGASHGGTYTPFLSRPIFSFQRYHTLNDNCAVMQHCTRGGLTTHGAPGQ